MRAGTGGFRAALTQQSAPLSMSGGRADVEFQANAAQRRGLLDEDEAKRASKDSNNMAEGFQISGLGQLIDAGIQADRLIVFGD